MTFATRGIKVSLNNGKSYSFVEQEGSSQWEWFWILDNGILTVRPTKDRFFYFPIDKVNSWEVYPRD